MADKFIYKNETDQRLHVMGFGVVEAGKTLETDKPVFNENLTLVEKPKTKKHIGLDKATKEEDI